MVTVAERITLTNTNTNHQFFQVKPLKNQGPPPIFPGNENLTLCYIYEKPTYPPFLSLFWLVAFRRRMSYKTYPQIKAKQRAELPLLCVQRNACKLHLSWGLTTSNNQQQQPPPASSSCFHHSFTMLSPCCHFFLPHWDCRHKVSRTSGLLPSLADTLHTLQVCLDLLKPPVKPRRELEGVLDLVACTASNMVWLKIRVPQQGGWRSSHTFWTSFVLTTRC